MTKNMNEKNTEHKLNLRLAAWRILQAVLEEGRYSHIEIQKFLKEHGELSARDRAFTERIVRGTIEHLREIDTCIDSCSKLKTKKLKPAIRTVLRLSVYQLLYMDSVPERAVCDEAVKLVKKLKFTTLKGYVNGVLRTLIRNLQEGYSPFDGIEDSENLLALRYSMPDWIIRRYVKHFGIETAEVIVKAQQEPVKLTVYRNRARIEKETLQEAVQKAGGQAYPLPYGLDGIYLQNINNLEQFLPFKNGSLLVQDVSSMLQGTLVAAKPGEYIIDVCAAPGGKTFHAAMDMNGTGIVDCSDVSEQKTGLLKENAERLGLENVKISIRDARIFYPELEGKADTVIADLPCSGLGIIGRKPEIRYNITENDVKSLAALQREILQTVWRYVKPGGRLIYSTCTLTEEEDEQNYRFILENLPFEAESLEAYFPQGPVCDSMKQGYMKLLPGVHECDGFFISSAVRKKDC